MPFGANFSSFLRQVYSLEKSYNFKEAPGRPSRSRSVIILGHGFLIGDLGLDNNPLFFQIAPRARRTREAYSESVYVRTCKAGQLPSTSEHCGTRTQLLMELLPV